MKALMILLLPVLSLAVSIPAIGEDATPVAEETMTVHKDPNCGCCGKWMTHMEAAGFTTTANHPRQLNELKDSLGVPRQLRSCHTAVTENGYVFEGHIPARYVQAYLDAPPEGSLGLAVPAMPVGSPGMEVGDRFMPYDVLLLNRDGSIAVFAHVASPDQQ